MQRGNSHGQNAVWCRSRGSAARCRGDNNLRADGLSTLEIYDALYDATDFTYIGVRHENCGMHMADAYGRVTQTPGVFICGQAARARPIWSWGWLKRSWRMRRWWSSLGCRPLSTSGATRSRRLTSTSCFSR